MSVFYQILVAAERNFQACVSNACTGATDSLSVCKRRKGICRHKADTELQLLFWAVWHQVPPPSHIFQTHSLIPARPDLSGGFSSAYCTQGLIGRLQVLPKIPHKCGDFTSLIIYLILKIIHWIPSLELGAVAYSASLRYLSRAFSSRKFLLLKIRTLRCVETSGSGYPVTQRHIPEDRNPPWIHMKSGTVNVPLDISG